MSVTRSQLFGKRGYPLKGLRYCLSVYKCATLEELKAKVDAKELYPNYIFRIRGCGSALVPGKLAQYLFGLPSRENMNRQRIEDNLGAGI